MKLTIILAVLSLLPAFPAHAAPEIRRESARAETAIDGDTLRLAGGERLRLDGINTLEMPGGHRDIGYCLPSLRKAGPQGESCDLALAEAAKTMLEKLAGGRDASLDVNPDRRTDRYGRILAQLYVTDDQDGEIWAQQRLLEAGLAYVYPLSGQELAVEAMLIAEEAARKARRGIWALPEMQEIAPEQADAHYGHYAFVTGKVAKAVKIKNRIFLNFGRDYRSDFTVIVEKRDWKNFADHDLLALGGKKVRLRGYLHEDNGPMMRIGNPWQIETAE